MVDTVPVMSFLSRLKSITRYSRLWPPPRHHDVSSPWLFRPPDRCSFSVSGAYGSFVVMSSNVWTVLKRVPADVGLNLRIGISNPEITNGRRCESTRRWRGYALRWLPIRQSVNSSLRQSRCLSRSLQELGQLLALPQGDVGLLPIVATADELPLPLELAVGQRGAHALHLRAQQRFDSAPDVDLVRVLRHFEDDGAAVLTGGG